MLANVRQPTIRPVIEATVVNGAAVYTDEYDIYARLEDWGCGHKTVCYARGRPARTPYAHHIEGQQPPRRPSPAQARYGI